MLMPDRLRHRLHQHRGIEHEAVALVGDHLDRLALVAGLGEQLLRLREILRVALRLRRRCRTGCRSAAPSCWRARCPASPHRRSPWCRARAPARGGCARPCSSGSLVCNRMPVRPSAGVMLSLTSLARLQLVDVRDRQAVDDVERAAQQAGLGGRTVGDEDDADLVDLDLLAAGVAVARLGARDIIVEADQVDVLAALPFAELERAGADRLVPLAVGTERNRGG